MKKNLFVLSIAAMASLAHAQTPAPTKVGIIHVQNAILSTKDGQKAASELNAKFAPKKAELEKKQNEIAAMQEQLRKGSATMSDDAKNKLVRDIDTGNTALKRATEDAQADLDEEQGKLYQQLGSKLMAVLDKYARENGFAVIIDVSNQQTPVIWASNTIDITNEIISLYDKTYAAGAPTGAAAPAAAPRTPAPARAPASAPKK